MLNDFNAGTQKCCVGKSFFQGGFCAFPKAIALHIHADKIAIREIPGQPHRIFPSATGEFERNGVLIFKMCFGPVPFQVYWFHVCPNQLGRLYVIALINIWKGEYFSEFLKFVLASHGYLLKIVNRMMDLARVSAKGAKT